MKRMIKPKGGLYITGLVLKLFFFLALATGGLYVVIWGEQLFSRIFMSVFVLLGTGLTIWLILEICRYRIELREYSVFAAAYRGFGIQRHGDITFDLHGLKRVHYFEGVLAPVGETHRGISVQIAIVLNYREGSEGGEDGEIKILDITRFSKKQAVFLMQSILSLARQCNSIPVIWEENRYILLGRPKKHKMDELREEYMNQV